MSHEQGEVRISLCVGIVVSEIQYLLLHIVTYILNDFGSVNARLVSAR